MFFFFLIRDNKFQSTLKILPTYRIFTVDKTTIHLKIYFKTSNKFIH